jgi:hypothetical protein
LTEERRQLIAPSNSFFKFSKKFHAVFSDLYHPDQEIWRIPDIFESIICYGGHLDVQKDGRATITTAYNHSYGHFKDFNTFIFDGTADIDLDYLHEQYHVFDFEPLKTYEGLTIYQCDLISGSKTSLGNEAKLRAFCEDVKQIADENPSEKIFLPVFKNYEDEVKAQLADLIVGGRIVVAHYGETRGSNNFNDCSIIVLGGILHKGENYYIAKARAVFKRRRSFIENISSLKYDKVRRFNHKQIETVKILDMLVDYSQELKRGSQRDNSRSVEGKVYVFHNDKILLQHIGLKFPGFNIKERSPQYAIENSIRSKKNNKNIKAICDYIISAGKDVIYFKEIRQALDMPKNLFSNTMGNKSLLAYIKSLGYTIVEEGKQKKLVR